MDDPVASALLTLNRINDSWQFKTELAQASNSLKRICVLYYAMCEEYEKIDSIRKQLYHKLDKLDKEIIPKMFEDQEIDKIAIPEVAHSFYPLDKYSASIVDKTEAFKWLKKHKLGSLITETVNSGTLAATLRGRLEEEGLDPPECMKLNKYQITGMSKYNPKKGDK